LRFLFICLLICNCTFAQKSFVSADATRYIFIGAENPVSVHVDGYKPSELTVKVNFGSISKSKEAGKYIWKICDGKADSAELKVYCKNYLIKKFKFNVKELPDPEARIGRWRGHNERYSLLHAEGVRAELEGFLIENIPLFIKRYRVHVTNEQGKLIGDHDNRGAFFDAESKKILEEARPGYTIVIDEIVTKVGCLKDAVVLKPLVFNLY
jgi:hypothetical protein